MSVLYNNNLGKQKEKNTCLMHNIQFNNGTINEYHMLCLKLTVNTHVEKDLKTSSKYSKHKAQ